MMSTRRRFLIPLLCGVGVLAVAWPHALRSQQPQGEPDVAAEAEQGAADTGRAEPVEEETSPLDEIEQILVGEEEVLAGGGYTYDPGNRRDPFRSLLARREARGPRGPRPEGKPGLLIDEIYLTGIYQAGGGYIAQVKAGEKEKSYLLQEGDQLFDGDVISVNRYEVVFKQIIDDPAAIKPFREVVKRLNP